MDDSILLCVKYLVVKNKIMKIIMKFLILIFIFTFVNINFSSAWECKYMSKWEKCIEANNNWTIRWIDPQKDFLCRETNNNEEIIYNIILDEKFKPIDKEANEYLEKLEKNKNYYFWENKKKSFFDWSDDIEKKFGINWDLYAKYYYACWDILVESISCIKERNNEWWNVWKLVEILNDSTCIELAKLKLSVRKKVAYNNLMWNKKSIKRDQMKKYEQIQRTKYSSLFDLMMVNIWYWMRIAQKWPSKTKNPHQ